MEKRDSISYEYIRGLIEGEGCFTFSTRTHKQPDGTVVRAKIPAFAIAIHERDEELLRRVRDALGLPNKVYNHKSYLGDGYKRGRKAFLIVREFGSLKNIIIPFFYSGLAGSKGLQFQEWLEKIGNDPLVPESYRLLYRLHKCGYYADNPKFLD